MATIRLGRHTDEDTDLPDVCMKCGAPTTWRKVKTFSWYPRWVYFLILIHLLIFIIVALVMTRRRTVNVPLCDEHKNHWLWRQLAMLGGFVVVALVWVGTFVSLSNGPPGGDQWAEWLFGGGVVALLLWLVEVAILQLTAIRATVITDRSITLAGVSTEFIRAYEDEWLPNPVQLDQAVREQWDRPERRRQQPRRDDDRFERDEPDDQPRTRPPETYRPEDQ